VILRETGAAFLSVVFHNAMQSETDVGSLEAHQVRAVIT
jgi:hypothetical protein